MGMDSNEKANLCKGELTVPPTPLSTLALPHTDFSKNGRPPKLELSFFGLFYLAPQGAPKFPHTPLPYIVIAKGIISTYEF